MEEVEQSSGVAVGGMIPPVGAGNTSCIPGNVAVVGRSHTGPSETPSFGFDHQMTEIVRSWNYIDGSWYLFLVHPKLADRTLDNTRHVEYSSNCSLVAHKNRFDREGSLGCVAVVSSRVVYCSPSSLRGSSCRCL